MSANILERRKVGHSESDDQESAYWVLLYMIYHYLEHSLDSNTLSQLMRDLFDAKVKTTKRGLIGGKEKRKHLTRDRWGRFEDVSFSVSGILDMLHEIADGLSIQYRRKPSPEEQTDYETCLKDLKAQPISIQKLVLDSPVAKYNVIKEKTSKPEWFVDTLRKHAALISLPPSTTDKDRKYDYYCHKLVNDPTGVDTTGDERWHESRACSSRVHGLSGQRVATTVSKDASSATSGTKRGADEEGPEVTIKRMKTTQTAGTQRSGTRSGSTATKNRKMTPSGFEI